MMIFLIISFKAKNYFKSKYKLKMKITNHYKMLQFSYKIMIKIIILELILIQIKMDNFKLKISFVGNI